MQIKRMDFCMARREEATPAYNLPGQAALWLWQL